jgi:hypothetical protein
MSKLWSITSLLVIAVLFVAGCNAKPQEVKPLTDEQKDRLVEIALKAPEISEQMEKAAIYQSEVKWVALARKGEEIVNWTVLTDEEVEMGIPHGFASSVTIYPGVLFRFSSPERMQFIVAIDLEDEKVMYVEMMPDNQLEDLALSQ